MANSFDPPSGLPQTRRSVGDPLHRAEAAGKIAHGLKYNAQGRRRAVRLIPWLVLFVAAVCLLATLLG